MEAAVLIEGRRRIDLGEAEWLAQLAEFDAGCWWAADGHLSCVAWLVHHCGMGYSTAKDKLRVALELTRRPPWPPPSPPVSSPTARCGP
jgi:hypothetical protein